MDIILMTFYKKFRVRTLYGEYKKDKIPIKIISLVREPISRNISAFFQGFEKHVGLLLRKRLPIQQKN